MTSQYPADVVCFNQWLVGHLTVMSILTTSQSPRQHYTLQHTESLCKCVTYVYAHVSEGMVGLCGPEILLCVPKSSVNWPSSLLLKHGAFWPV